MKSVTKQYSCCSCGTVVAGPNGSLVEIQQATGMNFVFNQKNGLTSTWVCPKCWPNVIQAVSILVDVFGEDTPYISLSNVIRSFNAGK